MAAVIIVGRGSKEEIMVSTPVAIPATRRVSSQRQPTPPQDKMSVQEKKDAGWKESANCLTSPCGQIMHYGKGANVV